MEESQVAGLDTSIRLTISGHQSTGGLDHFPPSPGENQGRTGSRWQQRVIHRLPTPSLSLSVAELAQVARSVPEPLFRAEGGVLVLDAEHSFTSSRVQP